MMKKYRKIIACIICFALVLGCIPASAAKATDNTSDVGTIYIEGDVKKDTSGDTQIYLSVVKNELTNAPASGITYKFEAKDSVGGEKTITLPESSDNTQVLTEDAVNCQAKITVTVSYTDTDGQKREGKKSIQIKNKNLTVDCLPGVSVKDASGVNTKDGRIDIKYGNNDMQYFTGTPSSAKDFTNWQSELLTPGQYGVKFKKEALQDNKAGLSELYAYYKVGYDSSTPAPTYQPTEAPTQVPSTGRPTYVPPVHYPTWEPTLAPTETPEPTLEPTLAPTETPEPTLEPTLAPTETPEPTLAPTEIPEPTVKPTIEPENTPAPTPTQGLVNMSKPGTKVTQNGNSYTSTGNNEVAYSGCTASKKTVTVPDAVTINGKKYAVTKIEAKAFSGTKIQKVTLGKNVKNIGKAAFKNCKSLKSVKFPSKLAKLEEQAFYGCEKLTSASLPSSTKAIGKKAFKNCKGLKKFKIGKTPAKTKKGCIMFGATGGTKISIGANALENCINLRSVIINSQVTKIGNATFKNCKKLASMLVKTLKLRTVGNKALQGVSNCKISVPTIRLKKYRTLFTNKGQGKKVVIAKV